MKKLFGVGLVLALLLTGCGSTNKGEEQKKDDTPVKENVSSGEKNNNDVSQIEIIDSGYHSDKDNKYLIVAVVLKNPNLKHSLEFPKYTFTAYDDSGKIIGTDEQVLSFMAPGDVVASQSMLDIKGIKPEKVEFKISNKLDSFSPSDSKRNLDTFKFDNISDLSSGIDLSFTGEVTNESNTDFDSVQINVILKKDGKIVYGLSGYVDNLNAGDKLPFEVISFSNVEYDSYDVYGIIWF